MFLFIYFRDSSHTLSCKECITTGNHFSSCERGKANFLGQCLYVHCRQVTSVHTICEYGCRWTGQVSCSKKSLDIGRSPRLHLLLGRQLDLGCNACAATRNSNPSRRNQFQLQDAIADRATQRRLRRLKSGFRPRVASACLPGNHSGSASNFAKSSCKDILVGCPPPTFVTRAAIHGMFGTPLWISLLASRRPTALATSHAHKRPF